MKRISLAFCALAFGILINSCNDPSALGSELLEEDQVDIFHTDTISIIASTVQEDSILTFDPNPSVNFNSFQFGDFNDPIFGNVVAGFYGQIIPGFNPPNYTDAVLDSIILTLQYDSSGIYGKVTDESFGLGIYRIMDVINLEEQYFSNQTLIVDEAMPLAEISSFTPMFAVSDSIKGLIDYTFNPDGDTITIAPSLRIPLPLSLGDEFINYDSVDYSSNTNFLELFNGIHVRPLVQTPGMLSFDISALSTAGITVYYSRDTVNVQYEYDFSSRFVQFNNFKHDRTGTIVEDFINTPERGDSLLFIQAMAGPNVKIEFPEIEAFQNVIINKAELIFTVAIHPDDDQENYPPIESLIAADINDNDEFVFLSDIVLGGNSFGGRVETVEEQGEIIQQYSMNISGYFQDIIDEVQDNTIYLRAFPKQERSDRVIIYGPGHSKYPMKLQLTYTKLD